MAMDGGGAVAVVSDFEPAGAPAPQPGNMAEVYAEFWQMYDLAGELEPAINQLVSRSAALNAEVSDNCEANPARWYLVNAFPGDDLKALRWLARRHFGVFRPMRQREVERNGRRIRVQGWTAAFPGWLLVYTWNIEKVLPRILAQPGVQGVFRFPVSGEPVPIPDKFVTDLQQESWDYNEHAPKAHAVEEGERHIRRRTLQQAKPKQKKRKPRASNKINKLRKAAVHIPT